QVWDPRGKTWVDRGNSIHIDPHASYALAATSDYFALASYQASRADLQIYYFNSADIEFQRANLQVDSIQPVLWQDDSTPDTFWSLGLDFATMTYITSANDTESTYKIQVQQWNDRFDARITLDETYTVPRDTKLPFAQSVASGSVVGNVGHLFRF